ncbi:MAG: hypothetical protein KDA38_05445 [Planctomycetales bacterium]|nr:hypothetical protein [Planctomycetales bacterium]
MPSYQNESAADRDGAPPVSDLARNVISLVVFIHLFFVALCLGANVARSEMHGRLINAFGFYVQSLNLNPDFTPYHLTHGTLDDVDHRIEVLPKDADPDDAEAWVKLPDGGYRACDSYKRYQRLAKTLALLADMEEQSGSIARDVGEHFVHERGLQPVRMRARRHTLQHWRTFLDGTPDSRDPDADMYLQTPYDADLIVTDDGVVFPNKRADAGESAQVARPEQSSAEGNAGNSEGN